jgi:hypothetical protein
MKLILVSQASKPLTQNPLCTDSWAEGCRALLLASFNTLMLCGFEQIFIDSFLIFKN